STQDVQVDEAFGNQTFDLRQYAAVLRARKWTILIAVILVVGAALGLSYLQTPVYEAEARVLVQPLLSPNTTAPQPVDVDTESQIVGSEPVAVLVQQDLGTSQTISGLLAHLTVEGAGTATTSSFTVTPRVLLIQYNSTDAAFAQDAANAFADDYIQFRKQQALQSFRSAQRTVQERVQAASRQLNDVTDQIDAATKSGDQALANSLETQRSVIISRLGTLQQKLDSLQPDSTIRSGGAQVIQAAQTPSTPVSPNFIRNGFLAFVVGIGLGIALAFLRDRLDDRFKGRADIEAALGMPVLGTVPRFEGSRKDPKRALVATADTHGGSAEAYRTLRTNLQYLLSQRGTKSIVVTSGSAGEGKTTTVANLGVVFAQAGQRVVLVSADLRRPSLARYFGIGEAEGLSTFLTRGDSPWGYLKDPGVNNLRVMPSGAVPANPAELLTSPLLREFVSALTDNADLVIIDSPPTLAVADASILARVAGGALLVIDATSSRRSAAIHARDELQRGGGVLLGTILNAFDPGQSPYYYAPYYYSSDYSSREAPAASNGDGEAASKGKALSRFRK
ncbi:MAG: polysaccharide biosynthesis tyrosine autokinase, partial [Actinomycetota bacterium]|nr:polysaccharide biosynthesis tyrosine autokinase [Actinomycetota bacterium]